ncbi:MAG: hypothetical protein R2692_08520 [Microbacterium sp.]
MNLPVGVTSASCSRGCWCRTSRQHRHRFDMVGVFLSALGLFLVVFGLQEGEHYDWAPWVWAMIIGGVLVILLFLWQQSRTRRAARALELFRDRNFSVANIGIATVGFAVTAMSLPMMFFTNSPAASPRRSRHCC